MNIVERNIHENMEKNNEEETNDIKTEQESTKGDSQNSPYVGSKAETSSPARYPYQNDIPPVYMSSIAQSTSYDYTTSNDREQKYVDVTSDYNRQYQASPPNIDKAPSFITRALDRNGDPDSNASNGTAPPSPATTPPEDKHVWSKSEVELLLDLYESYKDQLKDPRVRKTKVWEDIARIIRERLESDVNGCQCNQKFRNLKADFQKVIEHNGRPGNFKRVCKYYDRLANILNYPVSSASFHSTHTTYSTMEHRDNGETIPRMHYFYENGRSASPLHNKVSHKRKLPETLPLMNGHGPILNGHTESYYPAKKSKPNCSCECSHEIATLRETIERVNNYVVARSAHEEERMRRLEEVHREKLIAVSRFVDIFKDFIHKMT